MTDDVIARTKAALEGVTEEPWRAVPVQGSPEYTPQWGVACGDSEYPSVVYAQSGYDGFGNGSTEVNARFIAVARTLVPELVAEVERLRPSAEARTLTCDAGCLVEGAPMEECSAHGRTPADLWAQLDIVRKQRDAALAEVERLHTWDGLMSLLDEHWPESIFPAGQDDLPGRDPGPRIISLIRWVDRLSALHDQTVVAREEALAEVERLRGALDGLADGWASCDEIAECLRGGCWESFRECAEQLRAVLRGDQ